MNYAKLLLHKLMGVDIVKVFSLNAMATFVRMLAGMISVKIVALIIGPAGIALLGQLNNFNTILLGLANGGISSGITKYVAEYKEDENLIKKYLSNALRITLICSVIVAFILIVGCKQLSELILLSDEYYYVFMVFGLTIVLYSLNGLLISVLNGYKQFEKYVEINIVGTLFGLIYSVFMVYFWGLPGALINAVTFQSIVFFSTLWMCRKQTWLKKVFFKEKFDKVVTKKYFGYSLMTLTTLALLPISQLILRGYVISEISATDAGIWEGMNRVSGTYLSVITTALSVYYLPRLSEITDNIELRNEIFKCYKFIIPMLLLIGVSIYVARNFIIWLLFTPDFQPMGNLFVWQLFGDLFKISSWLLAFIMVAKARTKMFITTEVVFGFTYLLLCFICMKYSGIVGLAQGYLINYILYMATMCILFRKVLVYKSSNNGRK